MIFHPHPAEACIYNKKKECVMCGERKQMKCKSCGASLPENARKIAWYTISFITRPSYPEGWALSSQEVDYDSEYEPLFECRICDSKVTEKQAKKLNKLVY